MALITSTLKLDALWMFELCGLPCGPVRSTQLTLLWILVPRRLLSNLYAFRFRFAPIQ